MNLFQLSDNLIELVGPTDVALNLPITGATVSAKFYDRRLIFEMGILETFNVEADFDTTISPDILIPKIRPCPYNPSDVVILDGFSTVNGDPLRTGGTITARDLTPVGWDRLTLGGAIVNMRAPIGSPFKLFSKVTGASIWVPIDKPLEETADVVLEVRLDSGTTAEQTVSRSYAPTVTYNGAIPPNHPKMPELLQMTLSGALSVGKSMRVKLGTGSISMAQYGTPAAGSALWGYRGTVPHTHAAVARLGRQMLAEITLVGGTLDLLETFECQVVRA